ncbi:MULTISPECIES: PEP/pyruvate-binding domain-containing protein [Burkholderia]|uniref:Phosphoenolpyruvate synthase n=1 Tax=Burkholderia paludis TaxID=1506587 RepID=A0A6J5DAW9_9BURK|nr:MULTISPECIES: PEP/pyruvate-binding domain-containing protein [Burkholderia]CAB3751399.1 Prodigiosin synthesizing transferase PigC [Burkholderia paludis]VWB06843.1 phosphoenolpyruvate synthase [Burkholderia paludis]
MTILLSETQCLDPREVGFKFSRQAELRAAGFPVPRFRCVPVSVFDSTVGAVLNEVPRPSLADGDLAALKGWSLDIRARIDETMVCPADLAGELVFAFGRIAADDQLVAVRACAVADDGGRGEDSADDPFAGLSDSFLYVPLGALVTSVLKCWASAFNVETMLYRHRRGLDPAGARVAVGIQTMISGSRSFVAFTRDPRDASDRCVIAAAYGIGEGVVQEKADIDHFFVERDSGRVTSRLVSKQRLVGHDRRSGAIATLDVPPALAGQPVLDDEAARSVAELAVRVERHFGVPQDIEGTITDDGAMHLLQARPIALARQEGGGHPRPGPLRPVDMIWSNSNITESFPGVTSALTFSLAAHYYDVFLTDGYRRWGVPRRVLRRNADHLSNMIGQFDGRIYCCMSVWYHLHGHVPIFWMMRETWERSFFGVEPDSVATAPARRRTSFLSRVAGACRDYLGIASRLVSHPLRMARFLKQWRAFVNDHRDLDGLDASALIAVYREMWAIVAAQWGVTLVNGFFLVSLTGWVRALIGRWTPAASPGLLNGLLCGGTENRSVAALRSTISLSEQARAHPGMLCALLGAASDVSIWRDLEAGRYGNALADAAARHLSAFGDRNLSDLKLEAPTPRQQPWRLIGQLRPFVEQQLTVESSRQTEARARSEAESELQDQCRWWGRRIVLRSLVKAMRWFMRMREDTRFCRSELFGMSREVFIRLGAALADAGLLDRPDDVFDLSVDEVLDAFSVGGTIPGSALRVLARERGALRHAHAQLPDPPKTIKVSSAGLRTSTMRSCREHAHGNAAASASADVRLQGIPSSRGVVRGRARVVLDPASVEPSSVHDQILIAKETDPGWLFLMLAAKGLIAERGTLLSHTAITGRVLGIPTVVSVADATRCIADGAWIELDGAAGTVRLLQQEEAIS